MSVNYSLNMDQQTVFCKLLVCLFLSFQVALAMDLFNLVFMYCCSSRHGTKIHDGYEYHSKHRSNRYWIRFFRERQCCSNSKTKKEDDDISLSQVFRNSSRWEKSEVQVLWAELFYCNCHWQFGKAPQQSPSRI